jgi:hypothetical protein
MRRLFASALVVALLAVLAVPVHSAHAAGFADIFCAHGHFAQVDPILKSSPMTPPDPTAISGHLHEFFGNTNVNSNSTVDSLMQGQSTCQVGSDEDAIWTPAMIGADGNPIPADSIEYRIINQSNTPSDVARPPNGIAMIGGDPERTVGGNPAAGVDVWTCLKVASNGQVLASGPQLGTIPTPAQCPPDANEIRLLFYGSLGCWDGVHMGPGLQRGDGPADAHSHATTFGTLDCPASVGVKLPRFSPIMHYPASAAGGHLSSDHGQPGASFHWDLIWMDGKNTSGQEFWPTLLAKCLNNPVGYVTCKSTSAGTMYGYYYTGSTFHNMGTVLEAGPNVPPVVDPPASAVPLLGYDYTSGPVHYYSRTPVSPNPPWAPIASPARVEAPPCESSEKPLDWLYRYSIYTWTDDAAERATLVSQGYTAGATIACTVAPGTAASVPLYRVTKADGDRLLTVSTTERDELVAAGGTSKTLGNVYPPG